MVSISLQRLSRLILGTTFVNLVTAPAFAADADTPYPPLLETKVAYQSPTKEQKLWALATCAVLTESNRMRHDLLGGCERTAEEAERQQKSLAEWWDVHNRDDLLKTLKWIEHGGHRQQFDKIVAVLAEGTLAQLKEVQERCETDQAKFNRVLIALKFGKEFGAKSIAAWDYDRYVALCGWAYVAGYLSEEEAWQRIMPAARLLQKTFNSWEDLGKNHVTGREFWSWQQTQARGALTRQCYNKLLTDKTSPWVQLKWNLELGGPKTKP